MTTQILNAADQAHNASSSAEQQVATELREARLAARLMAQAQAQVREDRGVHISYDVRQKKANALTPDSVRAAVNELGGFDRFFSPDEQQIGYLKPAILKGELVFSHTESAPKLELAAGTHAAASLRGAASSEEELQRELNAKFAAQQQMTAHGNRGAQPETAGSGNAVSVQSVADARDVIQSNGDLTRGQKIVLTEHLQPIAASPPWVHPDMEGATPEKRAAMQAYLDTRINIAQEFEAQKKPHEKDVKKLAAEIERIKGEPMASRFDDAGKFLGNEVTVEQMQAQAKSSRIKEGIYEPPVVKAEAEPKKMNWVETITDKKNKIFEQYGKHWGEAASEGQRMFTMSTALIGGSVVASGLVDAAKVRTKLVTDAQGNVIEQKKHSLAAGATEIGIGAAIIAAGAIELGSKGRG